MAEQIVLTGMVLKAMPIGEYDKRLVILTGDRGKITAFAKGSRKLNSSMMAGSRPFSLGDFTMYAGKNSYNVVNMSIKNYFTEISTNLDWICLGTYFLEMCDYFGRENEDAREMVNLLYCSLKAVVKDCTRNSLIRRIFEIRLLTINGLYPDISQRDALRLNSSTLYAIEYIISAPMDKLYSFTVTEQVKNELSIISDKLCHEHIDRKIKSLEMLGNT